jgi:hypothetical protein
MDEDFSPWSGPHSEGRSWFRGAVATGVHVALVTWKMEGDSAGPALYQMRLNRQRRLTGTWHVGPSRHDKLWFKQKLG